MVTSFAMYNWLLVAKRQNIQSTFCIDCLCVIFVCLLLSAWLKKCDYIHNRQTRSVITQPPFVQLHLETLSWLNWLLPYKKLKIRLQFETEKEIIASLNTLANIPYHIFNLCSQLTVPAVVSSEDLTSRVQIRCQKSITEMTLRPWIVCNRNPALHDKKSLTHISLIRPFTEHCFK